MLLDEKTKIAIRNLNLGLHEETVFSAIDKWPKLAERLDIFILERRGNIVLAPNDSNSEFENNTIYISKVALDTANKYGVVLHLAHEVTHALSTIATDDSSLEKYVTSRNEREAEALLYEFSALLKIYPGLKTFNKDIWKDDEADLKFRENIFADVFRDVFNSNPNYDPDKDSEAGRKEKIKALAKVNKEIVWGAFQTENEEKCDVLFTYGEMASWDWLNRKTNLAIDYLEAFGISVTGEDEEARRKDAFEIITTSAHHSGHIKVLVNQANNITGSLIEYLGKDAGDFLLARESGSALGQKYGYEVLWGAGGEDKLYGRDSINAILLGGEGADFLYGANGDDILAGNEGDDQLYGGAGVNRLYGGAGHDYYYIGEGLDIISDQDKDGVLISLNDQSRGQQLGQIKRSVNGNDIFADNYGFKYILLDNNMYVFRPDGTVTAKITDFNFTNNNYGLSVFESVDYPLVMLPGVSPGGGEVFHSVSSVNSLEGQLVGIKTGIKNDLVTGGRGNEIIDLGEGNDYANGGLGNDIINGGADNDVIYGSAINADENDGDKDNDTLIGGSGRDLLYGGIGNDLIITGTTQYESGESEGLGDWAVGGSGNDFIFGGKDDDFLNGGAGEDFIYGGGGDDIILGDGDIMFAYRAKNHQGVFTSMHTWSGTAGTWSHIHNLTFANYPDPEIFNWSITQTENGAGFEIKYDDSSLAYSGETMAEGGGNDILYGGAGNDRIYGQTGDDYLEGGTGDDYLEGGSGNDIYFFNIGDGKDTINNFDEDSASVDELHFGKNVKSKFMLLSKGGESGQDLIISFFDSPEDQITVLKFFDPSGTWTIDNIKFDDGTIMTKFDILKQFSDPPTPPDPENHAPVIADHNIKVPPAKVNEAFNLSVARNFRDDDAGDTLTYQAKQIDGSPLPTWLSFNKFTGMFDGTPPSGEGWENKTITIMVMANDGQANSPGLIFDIKIQPGISDNSNPEPTGSISDQTITVGQEANFSFRPDLFTDPDGDALTYHASLGDGQALPAWLRFDAANRSFSGTPPLNLGGQAVVVKVWANDGQSDSAPVSFTINVKPASDLNLIIGTEEDDILTGTAKADEIRGLGGNDTLTGNAGDDILDGGAGNDRLTGGAGNDTYVFAKGYGHDTVDNYFSETGAHDRIRLDGLTREEVAFSLASRTEGKSTYYDFVIRIIETGETITVLNAFNSDRHSVKSVDFGDGSTLSWEEIKAGGFTGTEGDDILKLWPNEGGLVYGQSGDDQIVGSNQSDRLYGGAGNDRLDGSGGDDLLDGGTGDDHLIGGAGNDAFVFGKGYGHDTVDAYDSKYGKHDKIQIIGLTPDEVEFGIEMVPSGSAKRCDFIVRIKETGETMTVLDGMRDGYYGIQSIEFGDGTILSWDEIRDRGLHGTAGDDEIKLPTGTNAVIYGEAGNDLITGNVYNDKLYGGDGDDCLDGERGDDLLDGGAGNDHLVGGAGDDIFVFGQGYGQDTVDAFDYASSNDRIRLTGLTSDQVEFGTVTVGEGNSIRYDFIIRIKETGETLTVWNGLKEGSFGIKSVEFGDGSSLSWDEIKEGGFHGTNENEVLRLYTSINGRLYGEGGDDVLYGSAYDDLLDGGAGNDHLVGGQGHDTYVFGRGYGHDTVDSYDGNRDTDRVRLIGLTLDQVRFEAVNRVEGNTTYYDLVIRIKETNESITIIDGLKGSYYGVNSIEFGDSTILNWEEVKQIGFHGTEGDDVLKLYTHENGALHGGAGDDRLYGSQQNDALYGGAGHDYLEGGKGDDYLEGGSGDDQLYGGEGNDVLDGGAGNDHLVGGNGDDVFVFGQGYGHDTVDAYDSSGSANDRVRLLGLSREDVIFQTLTRVEGNTTYYDLVIKITETGESLTVINGLRSPNQGIASVEFGDGSSLSWEEIRQSGFHGTDGDDVIRLVSEAANVYGGQGNDHITGSHSKDELYGGAGDDRLYGQSGNDILDGGTGDDYLEGGNGSDTYIFRAGDGRDVINNYDSTPSDDVLKVLDVGADGLWFEKSGGDLIINLVGSDDRITINRWYSGGFYQIGLIEAGDSALVYNQVDQMVQAMAALGAPGAADGGWTDEQRDALNPILTTYWQPRV